MLNHALSELETGECIATNIIKSDVEHIRKKYVLFGQYGFAYSFDGLENGVPVRCMERAPDLPAKYWL